MSSVVANALAFAGHGHGVFPVTWPVQSPDGRTFCSCGRLCNSPAKHPHAPLAKNGVHSATLDTGVIKHWFGYLVPDANLGLATNRLVVVDVDPRHGGDESLQELEREHGEFPLTWRVLTGGGGEHIIYACPDGAEIANVVAEQMQNPPLGRGIDIRARDGYIVAPPSRHTSGRTYEWSVDHHPQDVRLTFAPDWLIARLRAPVRRGTPAQAPGDGPTPAPLGSDVWSDLTMRPVVEYRDMAAAKIIGHLFRHSCDYQLVRGLVHAWNSGWCKPPLGYYELDRIIERIADREADRIERQLARPPC
jgi:hypothetical protein